jgi:predicted transcriptional regulator
MGLHMPHANVYIKFLTLCETKNLSIHQYSAHISPKLLALFEMVAIQHDKNESMTVSQAMALPNMASGAAIHKRIDDLREAGMIGLVFKEQDKRTKYLIPTEKGIRYLKFMGQLMRCAAKHKTAK